MAQTFNLTAQINLRAPGNLKPVVGQIKRELGNITADVKIKIDPKSGRVVDSVTKKLQAMNAVLVSAKNNTDSLNAALQTLSASLTSTGSSSVKVNASIRNTGDSAASAAKNLALASTRMEEFGRQSALAVKRFAAFSVVTTGIYSLINAVNSGMKAFINFDSEMIKLQQVTGKGAIGLRNLEKEIRNLATSFGVSSAELADVASTLAQAGLSADETRIALRALAKTELAPSFDNMKETTEGAIAAIRQFGLEAKDLEKVLGSINAVAAAFAVESADIITAIQRTGSVFSTASKGVSEGSDALNEFIAIFTSVRATTRESAETIATGLRTIFTRIQRVKTIEQLKAFGVQLQDLEGKFVGPYEAVKRLSAALNQLDPRSAEFATIVEELGGFRQIGKVIPLIQQFATAQQALSVAQKGQNSISEATAIAQKSLAVQLAKVREQFLSLIASVGKSQTFQNFLSLTLKLTSGLISLAGAFKPILPYLAIIGTIKGFSAITQFASGFSGGISKGGGAKNIGANIGGSISGANQKEKNDATALAARAIADNTSAITRLTSSVDSLTKNIDDAITSIQANTAALIGRGPSTLNSGGKVMGFASGGVVPGTGNRDTVPAMLQPGEFVIRKKAVKAIGTDKLHRMNKYAKGGKVKDLLYAKTDIKNYYDTDDTKDLYDIDVQRPSDKPSFKQTREQYRNNALSIWKKASDIFVETKDLKTANKYIKQKTRIDPGNYDAKELDPTNNSPRRLNRIQGALAERTVRGQTRGLTKLPNQAGADFAYARSNGTSFIEVKNKLEKTTDEDLLSKALLGYAYIRGKSPYYFKNNKLDKISGLKIELRSTNPDDMQQFATGGKALGARSKFKELTQEEILQLSTPDLIAYGKALARDVFSRGGAGMAVGSEFIEVPESRIIPELESSLVSYMGKRGFWREKVAPFARPDKQRIAKQSEKLDRQSALALQADKYSDEVAAREQQWTKIRSGSPIDNYLLSSLTDPILTDYRRVRSGESLDKQFHNTRLRKAVNEALESYDDFDYSSGNIDKLVSVMAAKRFAYGGLVQKFANGTEVESVGSLSEDILKRLSALGGPGPIKEAVGLDFINQTIRSKLSGKSITAKQLLSPKSLKSIPDSASLLPAIQPILEAAERLGVEKENQRKAQLARNLQAAAGGAYRFGLASIFGPNGEFGYSNISDAIEIEGNDGEKYLTQIIQKSLPKRYESVVEKIRQRLMSVPQTAAEELQYADIFGTGGPLAFDFDETLVKDADIPGKNFSDYTDLAKVQDALADAELTSLGQELRRRLSEYPQLLDSIRVLTARPQSNAPLLADTLQRLKLAIPLDKITGVSGGLNKVNNLSELETLIDDNLENINSVLSGGKKAIPYQQARAVNLADKSSRKSISTMEGYALEEMVRSLGVDVSEDDADPGRPIDFPNGLGIYASKWDLPSTIPTDTKRTSSSSAVGRLFKEAQRFYVQNFKLGGQVYDLQKGTGLSDSEFDQLVKFGNTNDFTNQEFKDYLAQYIKNKAAKKDLMVNSEQLRQVLLSGTRTPQPTAKQLALAEQLRPYANGGSAEDTVPALLTPGEFVVNKKAAQKIGYAKLHQLNKADKIQGYNKGGAVGVQKFALGGLTKDERELVEYKAKESGVSVNKLISELRAGFFKLFKDIKDVAPKQAKLRADSIEAKEKIKAINASSMKDKDKIRAKASIEQALIEQIKAIDPKLSAKELQTQAADLMAGLEKGLNLDDILASSAELNYTFVKTISDTEAYAIAQQRMAEQTGLSADAMGHLVEATDIAADSLKEKMGQEFGKFGSLFPKLADSFSKTRGGRGLVDLSKMFSGDKIADAIGKRFGFLGASISEAITSKLGAVLNIPGGPIAALGAAASAIGSSLPSLFDKIDSLTGTQLGSSPLAAGVAGGITGAGSYAASGAVLGGKLFGAPGALVAGIAAAIYGGFESFNSSFQKTALANTLDELNKSSAELDKAFEKLRKDLTFENLGAAEKATGDFGLRSSNLRNLAASNQGWRGYVPVALGGTSEAVQQESLKEEITGRMRTDQAVAELSQGRLRTLSDKEIDRRAETNKTGSTDSIYATSTAVEELTRSMLRARGATIGDIESIDEYTKRTKEANKAIVEETKAKALEDAAINAYVSKRKQEGATEEQINKELYHSRQKALDAGKQVIAEQEKERVKAEQSARAIKAITIVSESLVDVYRRMEASLVRMNAELDESTRLSDAYADALSGNAKIIAPSRMNEQILKNSSAYSMDEVKAAAAGVTNVFGGTPEAKSVTDTVVASKVIKDQLPALLRANEGKGAEDAIDALRDQFGALGLGGSDSINAALDEMEKSLSAQEGGIVSGEVTGKEIVSKLSETLEAGAAASLKVLETFNEGLNRAAQQLDKYNAALSKADDYFRTANQIRIDSELELRRTLGQTISFDDMNRSFNEEIQSLTKDVTPGGTMDAVKIGEFIRSETAKQQTDAAANSNSTTMAGGTQAAVQSQKAYLEKQAESARKINNANKALEKLANSGETAANALSKIKEYQQLSNNSVDYVRKVLTSNSSELEGMNKDLNAYTAVMNGSAGSADYNSLQFRQQAYRGMDAIQSLMPENISNRLKARMTRQMLEQTNPELLKQTAFIGPDGTTVTLGDSLQQAETGVNKDTQILIDAYNAATQTQIEANEQLGMNQLQAAQTHYNNMENILSQLVTVMDGLVNKTKEQVANDAAALRATNKNKAPALVPGATPSEDATLTREASQQPASALAVAGYSAAAAGTAAGAAGGLRYAQRRGVVPKLRNIPIPSSIKTQARAAVIQAQRAALRVPEPIRNQGRAALIQAQRAALRVRSNIVEPTMRAAAPVVDSVKTQGRAAFIQARRAALRLPEFASTQGRAALIQARRAALRIPEPIRTQARAVAIQARRAALRVPEPIRNQGRAALIQARRAALRVGSDIISPTMRAAAPVVDSVKTQGRAALIQARRVALRAPEFVGTQGRAALIQARRSALRVGSGVINPAMETLGPVAESMKTQGRAALIQARRAGLRLPKLPTPSAEGGIISKMFPSLVKNAPTGGSKGGLAGMLALLGLDLGVGYMGGPEALFGKNGAQVYNTGRSLAGTATIANPLANAANLGIDAVHTAGELIYDPMGKMKEYDRSGVDTTDNMLMKQDMLGGGAVGNTLGYLWQSVDEASNAFQRPVDSSAKLVYALGSLTQSATEASIGLAKRSEQEERAKKYKSTYDAKTGEMKLVERSQGDAFSKLVASEQAYARIAAREQLSIDQATAAKGTMSFQDFIKGDSSMEQGQKDAMLSRFKDFDSYIANLQRMQSESAASRVQQRESGHLFSGYGGDNADFTNAVQQQYAALKEASAQAAVSSGGSSGEIKALGETINTNLVSALETIMTQVQNSQNNNQNNITNKDNTGLSLDEKSRQYLESFSVSVASFGNYVNTLSKISLPSKIEIIGKYTFDVNLTGAAAFEEMGVNLKDDIVEIFQPQIDRLHRDLYDKTGGGIGSTTRPRLSNQREV